MRAGDIAALVILIIIFPPFTWFSYQMIKDPVGFSKAMVHGISRLYSKLGLDMEMVMRAIPLPWVKSRCDYYYRGTTGSPEKDAKMERFDRIWFRLFGLFVAFFPLLMLLAILGLLTGTAHTQ